MADEQFQRAFRASQPPVRTASGQAAASSGDPLAELARLIGQNDPFGEYGHNHGRSPGVPTAAPVDNYAPLTARDMHEAAVSAYNPTPAYDSAPAYDDPRYAPPQVEAAPFPPPPAPPPSAQYEQQDYAAQDYAADAYAQGLVPGQGAEAPPPGYEQAPFFPNNAQFGAEDEHFYDDVPPRRRIGVMAIAAVCALAIVGTAGAYGYRMIFGSSGAKSGPPPVIKAEATPSKVVPAAQSKDPRNGKLIYDRVNNGQNEKIVSREEQPVDVKDRPAGTVMPQGQNGAPQAALGNGVIGVEPKKIHTIAIRPSDIAAPAQGQTTQATPAPVRVQPAAVPRATSESMPAQRQQVARVESAPVRRAPPPSNAPLSLNPNTSAAPPAPQRPMRTASAPPPAPIAPARSAPTSIAPATAASGGYAVQISSRHNEADAQASFHSLQSKFPQQLGGRSPLIRRVDLGAKGVYYRAMVGPFGSAEEASQVCSNLKAAGGDCIVQRI
jgi:hypothetical protein